MSIYKDNVTGKWRVVSFARPFCIKLQKGLAKNIIGLKITKKVLVVESYNQ
ncbi:MAG: hypothetical protein ACLTML_16990 [Blautia faecis]